jgi:hypothetical protein
VAHGDGSISVAELRCDYNPFQASIAAFPTAIRHRRSDQVALKSKGALTRTSEVASGKSACGHETDLHGLTDDVRF